MDEPDIPLRHEAVTGRANLCSRRKFLAATAAVSGTLALGGCSLHLPGTGTISQNAPAGKDHKQASLRTIAAARGLLTGFALSVAGIRDSEVYRQIVAGQCSLVVAENAMKWGPLRPAPDRYFFEEADELLSYAEQHHIKMRGHNLCWHRQLPGWFAATANRQNARSLLTSHIRTVAGRYAGRIHSWDVVNEAVHVPDGRPDGLRISPWLSLVGEDYVEAAFRTAREADPAALLTYNDYGLEAETKDDADKRAAILLLLRRLRQRNVPLDAVGIQSHIKAGQAHRYGEGLRSFIKSCHDMQLEVFITEMDVDDRALPQDLAQRDAGVAESYRAYVKAVLEEPNVRAVLTWGVGDAQTWLNQESPRGDGAAQRPLLFDASLRAKAAFSSVAAALNERAVRTEAFLPERLGGSLPRYHGNAILAGEN